MGNQLFPKIQTFLIRGLGGKQLGWDLKSQAVNLHKHKLKTDWCHWVSKIGMAQVKDGINNTAKGQINIKHCQGKKVNINQNK